METCQWKDGRLEPLFEPMNDPGSPTIHKSRSSLVDMKLVVFYELMVQRSIVKREGEEIK